MSIFLQGFKFPSIYISSILSRDITSEALGMQKFEYIFATMLLKNKSWAMSKSKFALNRDALSFWAKILI